MIALEKPKPLPRPALIVDTIDKAIKEAESGNVWNPGGVPVAVSATISVGGIVVR